MAPRAAPVRWRAPRRPTQPVDSLIAYATTIPAAVNGNAASTQDGIASISTKCAVTALPVPNRTRTSTRGVASRTRVDTAPHLARTTEGSPGNHLGLT